MIPGSSAFQMSEELRIEVLDYGVEWLTLNSKLSTQNFIDRGALNERLPRLAR
jgi:hypothetical protein